MYCFLIELPDFRSTICKFTSIIKKIVNVNIPGIVKAVVPDEAGKVNQLLHLRGQTIHEA